MMNNVNLVLGVCLNYCVNGGLCYVEDGTGLPICICNPGFVGDKCELGMFSSNSNYCNIYMYIYTYIPEYI